MALVPNSRLSEKAVGLWIEMHKDVAHTGPRVPQELEDGSPVFMDAILAAEPVAFVDEASS
jgi:hypothetical protein